MSTEGEVRVRVFAQQEPADSALPAGDSVLFGGGCCKWLQFSFDFNILPCIRPPRGVAQLASRCSLGLCQHSSGGSRVLIYRCEALQSDGLETFKKAKY